MYNCQSIKIKLANKYLYLKYQKLIALSFRGLSIRYDVRHFCSSNNDVVRAKTGQYVD